MISFGVYLKNRPMETRNAHIIINKIMNNGSIACKSITGTPLIVTRVGSPYFFVRTVDIFVCVWLVYSSFY